MSKCKVCDTTFSLRCPRCSEKLRDVQTKLEGRLLTYYFPAHSHYSRFVYTCNTRVSITCDLGLVCGGKHDIANEASVCWTCPYNHKIPPPHGKCDACLPCIELYSKLVNELNSCKQKSEYESDTRSNIKAPAIYDVLNKGELVSGCHYCIRCKTTHESPHYYINSQSNHLCLPCVYKLSRTTKSFSSISYQADHLI